MAPKKIPKKARTVVPGLTTRQTERRMEEQREVNNSNEPNNDNDLLNPQRQSANTNGTEPNPVDNFRYNSGIGHDDDFYIDPLYNDEHEEDDGLYDNDGLAGDNNEEYYDAEVPIDPEFNALDNDDQEMDSFRRNLETSQEALITRGELQRELGKVNAKVNKMQESLNDILKEIKELKKGPTSACRASVGVAQRVELSSATRLATLSTPVKIPEFNIQRTTPQEYLKSIRRYYCALSYPEEQYLFLLDTVLSKSLLPWWRHTEPTIKTYEEFESKFILKFDDHVQANERMRMVQNRQQRPNEPTEVFIYELTKMSQLVFANEDIRQTLNRVRNALLFDIRSRLGAMDFGSVEQLLSACYQIHKDVLLDCRLKGETSTLPSFYKSNKSEEDKSKSNFNNRGFNGKGRGFNRGRFSYHGGNQFTNYENKQLNVESSNQPSSSGGGDQSSHVPFRGSNVPFRGSSSSYRGSGGSFGEAKKTDDRPKASGRTQCNKCQGFGHFARDCSTPKGLSLAIGGEHESENDQDQEEFSWHDTLYPNDRRSGGN